MAPCRIPNTQCLVCEAIYLWMTEWRRHRWTGRQESPGTDKFTDSKSGQKSKSHHRGQAAGKPVWETASIQELWRRAGGKAHRELVPWELASLLGQLHSPHRQSNPNKPGYRRRAGALRQLVADPFTVSSGEGADAGRTDGKRKGSRRKLPRVQIRTSTSYSETLSNWLHSISFF